MSPRKKKVLEVDFRWNVQPYQTIEELRQQYTQWLYQTSRKRAEKRTKEIQEWMQQHAPWKDRTVDERIKAYNRRQKKSVLERKKAEFEAGETLIDPLEVAPDYIMKGARAGLRVIHGQLGNEKSDITNSSTYRQMERLDKKALHEVNLQREKSSRGPLLKLPPSQSQARSYLSQMMASPAFKKKPILVEMKFRHHPDIYYSLWLEVAHGGKYNIIGRTKKYWLPKLLADIKGIANLKQFRGKVDIPVETSEEEIFRRRVAEYERIEGQPYKPFDREEHQEALRRSRWRRRSEANRVSEAKRYERQKYQTAKRKPNKKRTKADRELIARIDRERAELAGEKAKRSSLINTNYTDIDLERQYDEADRKRREAAKSQPAVQTMQIRLPSTRR